MTDSQEWALCLILENSEVQVEADAHHVILAAVGIYLVADGRRGCHRAVAVEGVHVTQIYIEILGGMQADTQTQGVAGEVEGEVVHVGIAHAVERVLP